jgi:hypothetical protein
MEMAMMVEKGTQVAVAQIPACDVCAGEGVQNTAAYADARMLSGPGAGSWAYLCFGHFERYGCRLGTGYGQELVQA